MLRHISSIQTMLNSRGYNTRTVLVCVRFCRRPPCLCSTLRDSRMSNPFYLTDGALSIFNTGAACSQNIQTLHIIRCFAGAFGPSPLTNAGGRIADMFGQRLVGLAMSLFVTAPFIGPALGPIGGGFMAEKVGWRERLSFLRLMH